MRSRFAVNDAMFADVIRDGVSIYIQMAPLAEAGGPPGLPEAADREGGPVFFFLDRESGGHQRVGDVVPAEVALADLEVAGASAAFQRHVGGRDLGRPIEARV